MEVGVGDVGEDVDVGQVIEVGACAFKCNRDERNQDEGQCEPCQPFPVALEQEGKRKRGGRGFEVDCNRQQQRGDEVIFAESEQACHD